MSPIGNTTRKKCLKFLIFQQVRKEQVHLIAIVYRSLIYYRYLWEVVVAYAAMLLLCENK